MENSLDVKKNLVEAFKRVDMFTFFNWAEQTVYFIYQDERTLTINEEIMTKDWFKTHLPGVEVVFGKVKKETDNETD